MTDATAAVSPLRRRMIDDMSVRNLSPATQRSYIHAVRRFSLFHGRSPDQLGLEDVRAFQVWDMASSHAIGSLPIFLGGEKSLWLLLDKAELALAEPSAIPAAVGSLRVYKRENSVNARRILRTIYGLSINEAALVHELSLGKTIVEAGRGLKLTPETSRNYSKRIYAKTGTASQADLVRLILTGLSPLA